MSFNANPRGRNKVKTVAAATAPARRPSMAVVRNDSIEVANFTAAVKEQIEVLQGVTGNEMERAWTQRDMSLLGLLGGTPASDIPADAIAIPLLTINGKYVFLTVDKLSSGTVTAADGDAGQSLGYGELQAAIVRVSSNAAAATRGVADSVTIVSTKLESLTQVVNAMRAGTSAIEAVRQALNNYISLSTASLAGTVYNQAAPASVWNVGHALGRIPMVLVTNAAGEKIEPDITNIGKSVVRVTHGRPMTGKVVCR